MRNKHDIARRHLDARFDSIRQLEDLTYQSKGWIKAIREALGMTSSQLAKRLNVTQPRITTMEKDEALGNIKLSTLKGVAEALDCKLVYTLLPKEGLEPMARAQAEKRARALLHKATHNMKLENQKPTDHCNNQHCKELAEELLKTSGSRLWDDN